MQIKIKKNSGKLIISKANTVFWLIMIPSILSGMITISAGYIASFMLNNFTILIVAGISVAISIVIFYFIAQLICSLMTGYGEIVENSAETVSYLNYIRTILERKEQSTPMYPSSTNYPRY